MYGSAPRNEYLATPSPPSTDSKRKAWRAAPATQTNASTGFVSEAATVLYVQAFPETVPDLARIPGIKWIAEKAYPRLMASAASPATIPMILQNNGAFTTSTATGWKLWNAGIDGSMTCCVIRHGIGSTVKPNVRFSVN